MTHEQFVNYVEKAIKRLGLTATEFGKQAVNDPAFVLRLRRGRSPSLRVAEKVVSFAKEREQ